MAGTRRKGGRAPAARLGLGPVPRGWTRVGHGASWGDPEAAEWDRGKGLKPPGKEEHGRGPLGTPTEAEH